MTTAPARLADEAARHRIRTDLQSSLLCQAGAGAGKTHALVERMVASVAAGVVDIGRMAAITFTRKAAGQMRGRFYLALLDASRAAQEDHTAQGARRALRLNEALRRVDECAIGTIHAFCARLLRERPVEAGLPPDFAEVEEREEPWLARAAWDRFLQDRAAAGDERLLALEDTGLTAQRFYEFFRHRCQYSELPLKPTRQPRPDLAPAAERASELVRAVEAQIPDPLPAGSPDELMATVRRLRHVVDYDGPASDADRERLLRDLVAHASVTLNRWGPAGSPAQALARRLRDEVLPQLQTRELKPLLAQWRRYVYTLAAELVDEAMAAYRKARLAAAQLTFNDLLEVAAAVLRQRPEVRADLQGRYERLFVDEFQDTDPLQAEVLLYLVAAEVDVGDWRRLTPRPGCLFLVGDEKQSIYRFRRADVEVFRLVRDRILASGGGVVELTTSFRSRPAVTTWLNDAFEPLFEGHDSRYQPEFARLQARREERPGAGVYRLRGRLDAGRRREEQVGDEAERIAAFIAAALRGTTALNGERGILGCRAGPGDFMILTRTRRHLSQYARALEARGVPYDITGAGSLRASAELRALVDALEAVLRTEDAVALTAYLRGPVVGLGDDEIYRLRQAGWPFRWTADPPEGVEADLGQRLREALARLRQLRGELRARPPAAALERFVETTGLAALAATLEAGSSRAGNLARVLSIVRDQQARHGTGWSRIAEQLRDLLDDEGQRLEEMTLETGRPDVVRVMNLHQAKGLEAKVVILADPADTSARHHGVDAHVTRLGDAPYLAMTANDRSRVVLAEPEGWQADAAEEARFAEAEELRLVYVAATRASDVLVVGVATHGQKGPWAALDRALADAPDLPSVPPEPSVAPGDGPPVLDLPGLQAERRERWQRALAASYALTAVTDDEEEGDLVEPDPESRGLGRRYGTVVHRLFESALTGRLDGLDAAGTSAYARALLGEVGLNDDGLQGAALKALARLRASPLWREVERAGDQVHTEVPFARPEDDGVRRGLIDLVYRVGDGAWKVVDFKTHRAGSGAARASLAARYGEQVAQYAAHWEAATGERVVERGLWLAAADGADCYLGL